MSASRKSVPPPDHLPTADFPTLAAADPTAFEQRYREVPRHRRIFQFLVADLAEHVAERLVELGQNARWLARTLDKRDSEISRWLSGTHNLTLESVAKLSDALEEDLLVSARFPQGFFGQAAPAVVVETPLPSMTLNVYDLDWRGGSLANEELLADQEEIGGEYSYAIAA